MKADVATGRDSQGRELSVVTPRAATAAFKGGASGAVAARADALGFDRSNARRDVQLLPEVRIELVGVAVGVAVTVGVAVAVAVGVAVLVAVAVAVAVGVPQELATRAPAALAVSLNSSSPCTVKLWGSSGGDAAGGGVSQRRGLATAKGGTGDGIRRK